jgi:hypothetical protein
MTLFLSMFAISLLRRKIMLPQILTNLNNHPQLLWILSIPAVCHFVGRSEVQTDLEAQKRWTFFRQPCLEVGCSVPPFERWSARSSLRRCISQRTSRENVGFYSVDFFDFFFFFFCHWPTTDLSTAFAEDLRIPRTTHKIPE